MIMIYVIHIKHIVYKAYAVSNNILVKLDNQIRFSEKCLITKYYIYTIFI